MAASSAVTRVTGMRHVDRNAKNHDGPAVARRLGEVFDSSAGYILSRHPDTIRAPDVSFLATERLRRQNLDKFLDGAPDLAVEVLSPGNAATEMEATIADYFDAGCRVVWIVDPGGRCVVAHRRGERSAVFSQDSTLTEPDLLPGLALVVSELFPN